MRYRDVPANRKTRSAIWWANIYAIVCKLAAATTMIPAQDRNSDIVLNHIIVPTFKRTLSQDTVNKSNPASQAKISDSRFLVLSQSFATFAWSLTCDIDHRPPTCSSISYYIFSDRGFQHTARTPIVVTKVNGEWFFSTLPDTPCESQTYWLMGYCPVK